MTCFDPTWIAGSNFDLRTDLRRGARSFWTMREKAKVLRKVCNVESSSFNLAVSPFKENNKLPVRFGMAIVSGIKSALVNFCLPPEGQEVVNLLVVLGGIISFFFHSPCLQTSYMVLLDY